MASKAKKRYLKDFTYFRQERDGAKMYYSGDPVYLSKDEEARLENKGALVEEESKSRYTTKAKTSKKTENKTEDYSVSSVAVSQEENENGSEEDTSTEKELDSIEGFDNG